ncbi:DUF2971 domain-containing protein [Psychromonas sp. SA13A]|uniref:DUF2971 domain-containing protein n=1 Tax=Psychromonas sp. SA13A TaxID=2686346 RepID=UPI00140796D4|nr:DUF2971 domain-containing protein [Psychromonas sp. SA13A]
MSVKLYEGQFKYKYMEYSDGAKFLIKDATMKFTHPNEFNDPFDCLPSYSLEKLDNIDKRILKKAADELGYNASERILNKKKMIANIKRSVLEGKWQNSIKDDIGICSLTTKPCNLLMWAHYANNHKGIVVEFKNEIPNNSNDSEKYLSSFYVEYHKIKPVMELYETNVEHDLLIKGLDWQYEDEIRCLDMHRKAGIHPYRRDLLESIILGVKFDEQKISEIKSIVDAVNKKYALNIKVYKAEIVKNTFKIYIPEHPIYKDKQWE